MYTLRILFSWFYLKEQRIKVYFEAELFINNKKFAAIEAAL